MNRKSEIRALKFLKFFIPFKGSRDKIQKIIDYKKMLLNCDIGEHTYIASKNFPSKKRAKIGKYCSIAREVLIAPGDHPVHLLTTHPISYSSTAFCPFFVDIKAPKDKAIQHEPYERVNIGNDVWVGQRAIIMDGVNIGDGAVIGAGAIVTKDIQPYAIAVGVPAKVIKYRFSSEIIEKLLELKWWDYPEKFIVNELPFDNIERCIEILEANKHLRIDVCEK